MARRLGKPLMPWQQAAIDVAYEYDPVTGLFRYDEVNITVPRQSGKTTLELAKKVHRLTVMARRLGPQRSLYTAQLRLKARAKLEADFAVTLRGSRAFREVPHARARPTKATEWRMSLNNGSEHIQFGSGSFLLIDAPSRTGAHGDTLDDGTIDEAFAHETSEIEDGMRPAMATRKNAQLWVVSTAGDERSKYLYRKVLAGRRATNTGEHGPVCYIEYSAPEDSDPHDPAVWAACMPARGHTITESFIAREHDRVMRKGPEGLDLWLRAYLNRWPKVPVLTEDGAFRVVPGGDWAALLDSGSAPVGSVTLAVEVTRDQDSGAICAAGSRADDLRHVEVADTRPGTHWIPSRLEEIVGRNEVARVVIDEKGPAGPLLAEIKPAMDRLGVEVVHPAPRDLCIAFTWFVNACRPDRADLRHRGQADLTKSLETASKRYIGDLETWERRSGSAPVVAASLALWAHTVGSETVPLVAWR